MRPCWRVLLLMLGVLGASGLRAMPVEEVKVSVDWNKTIRESKTIPTLLVVASPMLRRSSPIHDAAFLALKQLDCDQVRYVPWYPYPRLGVSELEPPRNGKTSWDFTLIDPLVTDFLEATTGHSVVMNFSTIPPWMFRTENPVPYPTNPDQVVWSYLQGTQLRDPSMKEVAEYYARLVSWYTQGGFRDEYGQWHASNHRYRIDYWEVLNEVDIEHFMTPASYTALYDAVVSAIREVAPQMRFVGLSLSSPGQYPGFFEYFLDPKNHRPGIPRDMISYHFYAIPSADQSLENWQFSCFEQADRFLTAVRFIESIRQRLSPETGTSVNEVGTALPEDMIQMTDPTHLGPPLPELYWNLSTAVTTYVFGELAKMGIDTVGQSHLLGYPGFFPNATMLDWKTGQPSARYWVLKLLRDNIRPGGKLVDTSVNSPHVFVLGYHDGDGQRKLLLVNKRVRPLEVVLPAEAGGTVSVVDRDSASRPLTNQKLAGGRITLEGFAVAVVTLAAPERRLGPS